VPTSPYNLIPPQILYKSLGSSGFEARRFDHDDNDYVFRYRRRGIREWNTLTVFLQSNGLFVFRTHPGYKSFTADMKKCSHQDCFCGIGETTNPNLIEESDDEDATHTGDQRLPRERDSRGHGSPREHESASEDDFDVAQTPGRTREPALATAQAPTHVPFTNDDFEAPPSEPHTIDFGTSNNTNHTGQLEDADIIITRRKKQRFAAAHEKLGHLSYRKMKLLARAGLLPKEFVGVDPPVCPGCAYGKAHRKPWRNKGHRNRKQIKPATAPGQVVSVDQLESPTPGLVPTHRGIPTVSRYQGATVFVDHFSDFTYVHLMTKMDGESTVEAKLAFERVASEHGVKVLHYHADNGLFDTKVFKASIHSANQTLSFCGVNAHHQNGKAENRIKDITTGARTALLHAAHRWPKAVHASLWPASLKHYTNLRNALPTRFAPEVMKGRTKTLATYDHSPLSKFSNTNVEPNLNHFHPFGSPVYVLENSLQGQKSHNKWEDRSRVGIFLCHSPHHASSVPLILNTQTGNVSPQFYCIYDDEFHTCKRDAKFKSLWQWKAKVFLNNNKKANTSSHHNAQIPGNVRNLLNHPRSAESLPEPVDPVPMFVDAWDHVDDDVTIPSMAEPPTEAQPPLPNKEVADTGAEVSEMNDGQEDNDDHRIPIGRSKSGRQRFANRFIYNPLFASICAFTATIFDDDTVSSQSLLQLSLRQHDGAYPQAFLMQYFGMVASSGDPDTMTLDEAMKQTDRAEFIKAMYKELQDHIGRGHWKIVSTKRVPKGRMPIPMVWSMKRKRNPVGDIVKWKARLCAGGHKSIEGIDYWDTYSPVVSWSTVRLLVTSALIKGWHMESIDFVLAFPQAPVKTDIFMKPPKVPRDFVIPDLPNFTDRFQNVYQLIKNLYGLKDAGRTWYQYLRKGLLKRGWIQSEIDTCVFTKKGIILVLYVDDGILISPSKVLIESELKSLKESFMLTEEGELKDYLGTRFIQRKDGGVELQQPMMIQRILSMVGLHPDDDKTKVRDTPALHSKLLDKDPDGAPRKQSWHYRSVIGCLSYLQAMIRPDLTFAVQQCARFCNDPRQEHEEAVKHICRYLLKTKERGLVLKPDKSRGLECFVDADWAGSWQDRSSHDSMSAKSRTGYMIKYAGCPVVWGSKMQTLVALSTTEAEYIALSSALREVIAIKNLMDELTKRGFHLHHPTPRVKCRVFEDNRSCIEIATNHKTRPRTKHLSVRLHHFRSHVESGTINIEHISTKEQIADIFTKPLPRDQFEYLRDQLMLWE